MLDKKPMKIIMCLVKRKWTKCERLAYSTQQSLRWHAQGTVTSKSAATKVMKLLTFQPFTTNKLISYSQTSLHQLQHILKIDRVCARYRNIISYNTDNCSYVANLEVRTMWYGSDKSMLSLFSSHQVTEA
jgi:hypothetical protein